MPAHANDPPQRKGWRESPAPSGGSPPTKSRTARWTKKASDGRHESAVLRYRLRVAFWSLLFTGLVGWLIVWLIWRPVQTPLFAFVVTNYASPIPPNAWASEDLGALRAMGEGGGLLEEKRIIDFHEVSAWESKEKWLGEIRDGIASSTPGGPSRNAIIIYLSLHGVVNEKGEPCLIPPGASPWKGSESDPRSRAPDRTLQIFG